MIICLIAYYYSLKLEIFESESCYNKNSKSSHRDDSNDGRHVPGGHRGTENAIPWIGCPDG